MNVPVFAQLEPTFDQADRRQQFQDSPSGILQSVLGWIGLTQHNICAGGAIRGKSGANMWKIVRDNGCSQQASVLRASPTNGKRAHRTSRGHLNQLRSMRSCSLARQELAKLFYWRTCLASARRHQRQQ
jgi:hypothetical protein